MIFKQVKKGDIIEIVEEDELLYFGNRFSNKPATKLKTKEQYTLVSDIYRDQSKNGSLVAKLKQVNGLKEGIVCLSYLNKSMQIINSI